MAIRYSDAAIALMAEDAGLRRILSNAHIVFYTGVQPTSANDVPGTAQAIIAFTESDGVLTAEVRPQWQIVLSAIAGTAGLSAIDIDNWDILGAEVTGTVLGTVTDDIATQINDNLGNVDFTATSDGADTLTIIGPQGVGADMNNCIISATTTGTITATPASAGAVTVTGVAGVNGITFGNATDGALLDPAEEVFYIGKPVGASWKGKNGFGPATAAATAVFTGITNGNTYTAGWGRICASAGDDGSGATSGVDGYLRLDFSVGVSGTDIIMSPAATFVVNITIGDEIESTINGFQLKLAKKMG